MAERLLEDRGFVIGDTAREKLFEATRTMPEARIRALLEQASKK